MSKSISNWPNKRSISDTANQKFHVVNQLWCEMAQKQASKEPLTSLAKNGAQAAITLIYAHKNKGLL